MKTLHSASLLAASALFLAGTAEAAPGGTARSGSQSGNQSQSGSHQSMIPTSRMTGSSGLGNVSKGYNNYSMQHGTKFSQGYFYKGKQHTHWTSRSYSKQYGCWTYYCPSTCCSYYWCEPACCYYPVTYCPYKTYCWPSCYTCVQVPVVTVTPVVTYRPVVSYQTSVSYRTVKTYAPAVTAEPVGPGPADMQRPETQAPPVGPAGPGMPE